MSAVSKKVKFYFCKIHEVAGDTEIDFDLSGIFANIEKTFPTELIDLGTSYIAQVNDAKMYEDKIHSLIEIAKLDSTAIIGKATTKTKMQEIPLEDEEYLGDTTIILYRSDIHVAMIQSNRNGLSLKQLGDYFTRLLKDSNRSIKIVKISSRKGIAEVLKAKSIRAIELEYDVLDSDESESLHELNNNYNADYVRIKYMIEPKSKEKSLAKEVIETFKNATGLRKLEVSIIENEQGITENIDLLHGVIYDYIEFNLLKRTRLTGEFAVKKMIDMFKSHLLLFKD